MAYDDNNVFAKILRGEIPCTKIYEDEHVCAFNDIHPLAPVHILVIPTGRYTSVDDFGANASPAEIKAFFSAIDKIVTANGLKETGFRCIANTGINGGQEVPHFHMHILGGRRIGRMVTPPAE